LGEIPVGAITGFYNTIYMVYSFLFIGILELHYKMLTGCVFNSPIPKRQFPVLYLPHILYYRITVTKNCVIKPVDLGGKTGTAVVLVATCELLKSIIFTIYGQYHTLINDFAANDHDQ